MKIKIKKNSWKKIKTFGNNCIKAKKPGTNSSTPLKILMKSFRTARKKPNLKKVLNPTKATDGILKQTTVFSLQKIDHYWNRIPGLLF